MYILALSGIAGIIVISQLYVQQYLTGQTHDSRVINLAGRQRMLSQRISKVALQLITPPPTPPREALQTELAQSLDLWTQSHNGLLAGDASLDVTGENSAVIREMFATLAPDYDAMVRNATQLLTLLRDDPNAPATQLRPYVDAILQHESGFLDSMDAIVFQYDEEARAKVLLLKRLEIIFLAISLTIILFELLFIFRPTARQIRNTIKDLIQSEKLAHDMAHQIGVLHNSLEQSYQELAEVNTASAQPIPLAHTDLQGDFTDVTEPFRHLMEGDIRERHRNLFDWLTEEGYAPENVHRIRQLSSVGDPWTGEVQVTSESGDFVWLDLYVVPLLHRNGQTQQLLLVGTNRTDEKEARARSQEITRERIEKKLKEQRFRSILILEGQEEERRRLARDLHDGIGQLLTALRYRVETLEDPQKSRYLPHNVQEVKHIMNQVLQEIRRISFNLTPSSLSDYGIVPVTKKYCAEMSRLSDKNIVFENKTGFLNRLEKSVETNLYRMIQEAVNNAIKYAQADEIRVEFSHNFDVLNVTISDNGVGFDPQQSIREIHDNGTGQGIFNMQERALFINAQLDINSTPGQGTRINIHIPIHHNKVYESY